MCEFIWNLEIKSAPINNLYSVKRNNLNDQKYQIETFLLLHRPFLQASLLTLGGKVS